MARIMAIDYGTKRVGVAVTDPMKIIASALDTVHSREVLAYIKNYVEKEPVECFVVGEPLRMNDEPSSVEQHIKGFIRALEKQHPGIPIEREDERFTSKMAAQAMVMGGMKKKKRQEKGQLDKMSAVLILQSYLGHV